MQFRLSFFLSTLIITLNFDCKQRKEGQKKQGKRLRRKLEESLRPINGEHARVSVFPPLLPLCEAESSGGRGTWAKRARPRCKPVIKT